MAHVLAHEKSSLPVILCLHGHGANGTIFRLQARRIIAELKDYFRFVFVDAPFSSPAGPGVSPIFDEMGPFWRWHCDENVLDIFDVSQRDVAREKRQVRRMLAQQIKLAGSLDKGPGVVGLMAFSQGTRVATGMCLDGELGERIRFVILIGGTFPFLDLNVSDQGEEYDPNDRTSGAQHPSDDQFANAESAVSFVRTRPEITSVCIPSLHVQGVADPWRSEGIRLKETYYDPNATMEISFKGRHEVPTGKQEAVLIAKSVLSAFDSGVMPKWAW